MQDVAKCGPANYSNVNEYLLAIPTRARPLLVLEPKTNNASMQIAPNTYMLIPTTFILRVPFFFNTNFVYVPQGSPWHFGSPGGPKVEY